MGLNFSGIVILSTSITLVIVALLFLKDKEHKPALQTFKVIVAYWFIIAFLYLLSVDSIWLTIPIMIILVLLLLAFLIPFPFPNMTMAIPSEKYDERLTIFSRMFEIRKGDPEYDQFYKEYPEILKVDEHLRALPGILSEKALFYNEKDFRHAEELIGELQKYVPLINGEVAEKRTEHALKNIESEISNQAKELGASSCGFTQLKPSHFYSRKGRGERYGKVISCTHKYAIAITVEMNHNEVAKAPKAPVIIESSLQYLNAAKIATGIASHVRSLGYEATAHIDANYEVICPTVARDAGLGTIGRMGILMTPQLGPRVRLAVVTTNLPLKQSKRLNEKSMQYFCSICKKCAMSCPSKAITFEQFESNDPIHYKIHHEKCYGYWAKVGTDCARCMSVCPFSHPNNALHSLVRFGVKNSSFFARIAYRADNYLYGKVPKIRAIKFSS